MVRHITAHLSSYIPSPQTTEYQMNSARTVIDATTYDPVTSHSLDKGAGFQVAIIPGSHTRHCLQWYLSFCLLFRVPHLLQQVKERQNIRFNQHTVGNHLRLSRSAISSAILPATPPSAGLFRANVCVVY